MDQVGGGLWGAVRRGFSRPLWTGGPRGHGLAVCTKGPFPGAGEAGAETQATTEETEAPCLLTAKAFMAEHLRKLELCENDFRKSFQGNRKSLLTQVSKSQM